MAAAATAPHDYDDDHDDGKDDYDDEECNAYNDDHYDDER